MCVCLDVCDTIAYKLYTFDASVWRFHVRHEIPLAWMYVDEISHADVTRFLGRALAVHVRDHVHRATDVEISVDASPEAHAPVNCRRHEYYRARPTGGVERFV